MTMIDCNRKISGMLTFVPVLPLWLVDTRGVSSQMHLRLSILMVRFHLHLTTSQLWDHHFSTGKCHGRMLETSECVCHNIMRRQLSNLIKGTLSSWLYIDESQDWGQDLPLFTLVDNPICLINRLRGLGPPHLHGMKGQYSDQPFQRTNFTGILSSTSDRPF